MTNNYPGLARGPIDHQASSVINMIANERIAMGSSVKLIAEPSSEILPRAEEGDTALEALYGVAVGGDADGIYGDGSLGTSLDGFQAADEATQAIVVVTQGRCLARVDTGVSIGDKLEQGANAGALRTATTGEVIAVALQASTGTDIIAVDVQREGAV